MTAYEYVYGYHVIESILQADCDRIKHVYCHSGRKDERIQRITQLARSLNVPVTSIPRSELLRLSGAESVHQGIAAEVSIGSGFNEKVLQEILGREGETTLLLMLDGVQDPHNLGACLRSANAFGVKAVVAPKDRAVGLTPVVRKAASGAAEKTPFIQVTNLARTITQLQQQKIWVVGLCSHAETALSEVDLSGNIAIVMGNEGRGMRQLTRKHCDFLAKIPMPGQVESLNVSAATAVVLYEVIRQRARNNKEPFSVT